MKKFFVLTVMVLLIVPFLSAETAGGKWVKYAGALYKKARYADAVNAYSKALTINPKDTRAITGMGYCYAAMGDYKSAIVYLKRAYDLTMSPGLNNYIYKLEQKLKGAPRPDSLSGGAARLAALGGPIAVLPDSAAMMDLYSDGFVSSYALRPLKSMIDMTLQGGFVHSKSVMDNFNQDTQESDYYSVFSDYKEKDMGQVRWIGDSSVIILRPCSGIETGSYKDSDNTGWSDENKLFGYLLSGELRYAQRVGNNFSFGGLFGYSRHTSEDTGTDPATKNDSYYYKFDYEASASYALIFNKLTIDLSVSGGKNTPELINNLIQIPSLNPFQSLQALFYNLYTEENYYMNETSTYKYESRSYTDMSGMNIGAGLSVALPDVLEAMVSAKVVSGLKGEYHGYDEDTLLLTGDKIRTDHIAYERIAGGSETFISFKGRYYLGFLIFGVSGRLINADIDFRNSSFSTPYKIKIDAAEIAGGLTLKLGNGLLIPIEPFMQTGIYKENDGAAADNLLDIKGIRAGVELKTGDNSRLRAGVDYSSGGTQIDAGWINSGPIGTDTNPVTNVLGLNAGFGISGESGEFNLAIRWEDYSKTPQDTTTQYKENTNIRLFLILGFKNVY